MSKKRGQNEGSIYKDLINNRWVAVVSLGWDGGKRRRKYLYGRTRRHVQEKLTSALRSAEQGLPLASDRTTLSQFLQQWLKDSVRPNVRPRTYESYAMIVDRHLEPWMGQSTLAKLGPANVQSYINAKLASGRSPRTVQYHHAVLRRALGQAERWGLVPRNVAKLVDSPKVKRSEIKPLSPVQCRSLLNAAKGERLEALYIVALGIGLRKGELLGLRWEAVNLDSRTLRVNSSLQYVEGRLQLMEPKTERSRRTIRMPATVVEALRSHRVRQLEERLFAGDEWEDWGLVVATAKGTPLDQSRVSKHFKRMLRNAGLPDIRFHDLRHSCASLLLAQHVPARVVMEILGHSNISLTMNTYSHVLPALEQEAADLMDDVLRRAN